jgi:hypothetical protein
LARGLGCELGSRPPASQIFVDFPWIYTRFRAKIAQKKAKNARFLTKK